MPSPVYTTSMGAAFGLAPFDGVIYECPPGIRAVLRTVVFALNGEAPSLYLTIIPLVGLDVTVLQTFTAQRETRSLETRVVLYVGEQLRLQAFGDSFSVVCAGFELTSPPGAGVRQPAIVESVSPP